METVIDQYIKSLTEAHAFLSSVHPLAAIWINKATILIEDGKVKRTCRLTSGQLIRVVNERIVDCIDEPATHEIVSCKGAINHSFSLVLKDIKTMDKKTISI